MMEFLLSFPSTVLLFAVRGKIAAASCVFGLCLSHARTHARSFSYFSYLSWRPAGKRRRPTKISSSIVYRGKKGTTHTHSNSFPLLFERWFLYVRSNMERKIWARRREYIRGISKVNFMPPPPSFYFSTLHARTGPFFGFCKMYGQ